MSARDTRQPLVTAATLPGKRRLTLFTLLRAVVILLALCLLGGLAKNALDQREQDRATRARLEALESSLAGMGSDQRTLQDNTSADGKAVAQLQHQIDGISATLNADQRKQWQLAEVDYYVRLAEQHLILTRDVQGARALLDVADRILAATNDNDLLKLRAAIAGDRLALAAAAQVDVAGTYLRLSALDQRLANLPVPMEAGAHRQQGVVQTPDVSAGAPAPAAASGWRDQVQGLVKFRGLITVRHYDEPIKPLLTDAQRALVTENLRLHLGQAQLALLRGEQGVYQASLKTAQDDFARYFQLLPASEYTAVQQELAALLQVQVQPAVPDLKASVGALDALSSKLPLHGMSPAAGPTATGSGARS